MSRESTIEGYDGAIAQAMAPIDARQLDLIPGHLPSDAGGMAHGGHRDRSRCRLDPNEAAAQLRDWPDVYFDDDGMVVGFWRLET